MSKTAATIICWLIVFVVFALYIAAQITHTPH